MTPLMIAVAQNRVPAARFLTEELHADTLALEKSGQSVLAIAAEKGSCNTVRAVIQLLGSEATKAINYPDVFGITPLYWAVQRAEPGMIGVLLNAGAMGTVVSCDGKNLLHVAGNHANKRCFELILDHLTAKDADVVREVMNTKCLRGSKSLSFHFDDGYDFLNLFADMMSRNSIPRVLHSSFK